MFREQAQGDIQPQIDRYPLPRRWWVPGKTDTRVQERHQKEQSCSYGGHFDGKELSLGVLEEDGENKCVERPRYDEARGAWKRQTPLRRIGRGGGGLRQKGIGRRHPSGGRHMAK